jgi:hypothetical protein
MRRRGIVCVEIPNQNLRSACVRQESCHAAIRRRKLLKLRRRNRAAVAGRMANGCFSGRTANRKKWVIEKKPGEQKTHKNLPQRDSTGPHCVAREVHCSWFDTSTPSLTTRCANRMPSVFVFVKSLPELEKENPLRPLGAIGRRKAGVQSVADNPCTIPASNALRAIFVVETHPIPGDNRLWFIRRGAAACELIDFSIPFWHSAADSLRQN